MGNRNNRNRGNGQQNQQRNNSQGQVAPRAKREPEQFEIIDPGGEIPSSQERKTLTLELRRNQRGTLAVIGERRVLADDVERTSHLFAPIDTVFGLILGLVGVYRGHLVRDPAFAEAERANLNDIAQILELTGGDPGNVSSPAALAAATAPVSAIDLVLPTPVDTVASDARLAEFVAEEPAAPPAEQPAPQEAPPAEAAPVPEEAPAETAGV